MAEQRPRIMYFKEYLPTPVCVALSMFFALVFQFNGGVFLPTAVQMSSALGCQPHHTACQQSADLYPRLFGIRFLPHVGNL